MTCIPTDRAAASSWRVSRDFPTPASPWDQDEAAPARSGLIERGLEKTELLVTPHDNRTQDLPHAMSIVGSFPHSHWSVRAHQRLREAEGTPEPPVNPGRLTRSWRKPIRHTKQPARSPAVRRGT